ncbi:MAG: glycosyltransferase family 39 protein [Patescibacteria group bacterium]|nr:glycosyltransferase family 39 protein [Patescibacteria group bacterium]
MAKKHFLSLIVLSVIFLVIYVWLASPAVTSFSLDNRFDWPDETANYFWTKNFAQTGELSVFQPLNLSAQNQIHPRSFNVRSDGSLVPGSFLGLILMYGFLAKIFGPWLIIYLTPILSVLGVLAFYGIVKEIFDSRIAKISAVLMFINPAWWYYSVTTMLPNVAFVSLALVSIFFLIRKSKHQFSSAIISGLSLGLAVSVRPSEVIWLAGVYLAVFLYRRHGLKFITLFYFFAAAALMMLPTLYYQQLTFGNFLTSGYEQLNTESSNVCGACELTKSLILPFGFHPGLATQNFWTHYLSRLWWLSLLSVLGLVSFLAKSSKQKNEIWGYLALSAFVFSWLGIYYGSWQFADQLTVNLNTLGLSYVRYWLPLYLLALPFTAMGLMWLSNFIRLKWRRASIGVMLILLLYPAAKLTLHDQADSILPVKARIAVYKKEAAEINQVTPSDAVVVTVRKDKVLFPERQVIHSFEPLSQNLELQTILPKLIKETPVYYLALMAEPNLELSNGLILTPVKNVDGMVLYQIQ